MTFESLILGITAVWFALSIPYAIVRLIHRDEKPWVEKLMKDFKPKHPDE